MKDKQLYLFGFQKDKEKSDRQCKVILSLDKLILSGAITVILLVLSFSLGVEKGKRLNLLVSETKQGQTQELTLIKNSEVIADSLVETKEELIQPQEITNSEKEQELPQKYRIQVASFYKENTAWLEAERLKEKGYPVFVQRKGKYAVVYVGNFNVESEARSNFKELQESYADCILRRL